MLYITYQQVHVTYCNILVLFEIFCISAEPDSPQPPVREALPHRLAQTLQPQSSLPSSAVGIMTKPPNNVNLSSTQGARSSPDSRSRTSPASRSKGMQLTTNKISKPTVTDHDSEYIPLEICTSGPSIKRTNRQMSVDSVPDDFAPPPPIIPVKGGFDIDNDVFPQDQTYDVPPSSTQQDMYDVPPSLEQEDDLYKVPPPRPPVEEPQEMYDIPPPTKNSPSTPRSSSSDSQKADSAYSSQGLMYDIPPVRPDDDVYDIPPSHPQNVSLDDVPPSRPPKPGHLQEPYMNLPPNSKAFTDKSKLDINSVVVAARAGMAKVDLELYDYPKSALHDNQENYKNLEPSDKLLMSTPPPPSMCVPRDHRYVNAAKGTVEEQDDYLPMNPAIGVVDPAPKPRKLSNTDSEVEYTDMSGNNSFDHTSDGGKLQIYDHPPPSRPAIPPPRPLKPASSKYFSLLFIPVSFIRSEGNYLDKMYIIQERCIINVWISA